MLRALLRFCDTIRRRLTQPPASATLPAERVPLPGPHDPETQRHLFRVRDETLARITFGLG